MSAAGPFPRREKPPRGTASAASVGVHMNADPVIRIHPNDNVVIARRQLVSGTLLEREGVTISGLVPPGHKVAVRAIRAGEPVRRYDQTIGFARHDIAPGQHVHTHTLA